MHKNMKKQFTIVNTQLQQLQEEADNSNLSDSEEEAEEDSHFLVDGEGFGFVTINKEFEPKIAKLFKQSTAKHEAKLNLREVWLLDSESTMDLACNPRFVKQPTNQAQPQS